MAARPASKRRARGTIETLASGSLRVKVYAGIDPVSKRRHFLTKTIPAGPNAEREAERARTRLLTEVDERRQPRTQATLGQLLDRHLDALKRSGKVGPSTLSGYRGYVKRHIAPLIGDLKVGAIDAYTLDSTTSSTRPRSTRSRSCGWPNHPRATGDRRQGSQGRTCPHQRRPPLDKPA